MTQYQDRSKHPDASQLSDQAYASGSSHYRAEDFSGARAAFEEALEYRPEDPRSWFALGNCHDCLKQPQKAEICYRMSLKFSVPDARPNVYFNLGNSLFDQGEFQKAVECYSEIDDQSKVYPAAQKNMELAKRKLPQ